MEKEKTEEEENNLNKEIEYEEVEKARYEKEQSSWRRRNHGGISEKPIRRMKR